MSNYNDAIRNGEVKFGYDFDNQAEVLALFGMPGRRLMWNVRFNVPFEENTIALLISEKGGNGWTNTPHYGTKTDSRGWRQIVRIDEKNENAQYNDEHIKEEMNNPKTRYVFWREEYNRTRWYKFHGVFKLDEKETLRSCEEGKKMCIYRLVSDTCECKNSL